MNWIELFAGSNELSQEAEKQWIEMFPIDIVNYQWIKLVKDIWLLSMDDIKKIPDFFWASPDCTTYSIAACWTHRNKDKSGKSDYAKQCDLVNRHWINLMIHLLWINPNMKCYIENPRWNLRHMDFIKELEFYWFKRYTIWYCQYWDERAKPTDIWTNSTTWKPRKECHNYKYDKEWNIIDKHCHHDSARRWSRTWTQWRKDSYERSKLPKELILEIILDIKWHKNISYKKLENDLI